MTSTTGQGAFPHEGTGRGAPIDAGAPKTPVARPKGTCVIVHRGCEVLMESGPGKRIVSVKFDVSRSDKDPIGTAYRKLTSEFEKGGAPAIYEVDLLAKWYDPSDSTVKVRLRIPHVKYASWRENSFTSITSTRALQRIDDRLDVTFDAKLPVIAKSTEIASQVARTKEAIPVVKRSHAAGEQDWSVDEVRAAGTPSTMKQTIVTMACMGMMALMFLLGGNWLIAMGPIAGFMLVDTGFYVKKRDRWRAVRDLDRAIAARRDAAPALDVPKPFASEWDAIRGAVSLHAPNRAEDLARAEMRVRSLLDANAPSINPVVVEAVARIGNGLRDLVAAYRTPASIATSDEARTLTERLADSICALGVEAEDARVVAFRDAVFDFDATTRYIESRNDPMLRIVDDAAKPRG